MPVRVRIVRASGAVEIPVEGSSLRIVRPLNQQSRASFRVQAPALSERVLYPLQPPFPSGRSPDSGGVQRGDRTTAGGLDVTGLRTGPDARSLQFVAVDAQGAPQPASAHRLVAGDLLLFYAPTWSARVMSNEPLVVTAVSMAAIGEQECGLVTVDYPPSSPLPRDYAAVASVHGWRLATGGDVVNIERTRLPAAPGGLRATPADGQVTLAWDDPPFPFDRVEYRHRVGTQAWIVRQADAGGAGGSGSDGWIRFPAGATASGAASGLTNGTDYEFEVRFVNAVGVGDASAAAATPRAALEWAAAVRDQYLFVGTEYAIDLPALSGGVEPLTVTSAGVPAGLRVEWRSARGRFVLAGTPTTVRGLAGLVVTARDNALPASAAAVTIVNVAVFAAGTDVSPVFPRAQGEFAFVAGRAIDRALAQVPAAGSGNAPITYAVAAAPALPGGVLFDPVTRQFHGAPRAAQSAPTDHVVTATDADGDTATFTARLRVAAASAATVVWGAVPDQIVDVGRAFSIQLPAASGSPAAYRFRGVTSGGATSGSPPAIAGLRYADATRTISGTIAAPVAATEIGLEAQRAPRSPWRGTTFRFSAVQVSSAPSAPASVSAAGGVRQVTVSFTAPLAEETVTGVAYRVRVGGAGVFGAWRSVAPVPASNRLVIGGLGVDLSVEVETAFVNAVGRGVSASAASVRTEGVPGGVTPSAVYTGLAHPAASVRVRWSAASGTVTGYEAAIKPRSAASWGAWTAVGGGASARETTFTGLTSGTRYEARVRAVNGAGFGPWRRLGVQTAFAAATGVEATPHGALWTVTWTLPSSGAAAVADRAAISGVRVWVERSARHRPFTPQPSPPSGFVSGSAPTRVANVAAGAQGRQWYRARVTVESGGSRSPFAYSTPTQIVGSRRQQAPPPPPTHRTAGPAAAAQRVPQPAWVRVKWLSPTRVRIRWAAVAGVTRYVVNVLGFEHPYGDPTSLTWAHDTTVDDATETELALQFFRPDRRWLYAQVSATAVRNDGAWSRPVAGPWWSEQPPAGAYDASHPLEVRTARPHGLTEADVIAGHRVVFEQLAGAQDLATGAPIAYPITRVASTTVFHVASPDLLIADETGAQNPRWRKLLRTPGVTPRPPYVPAEGEEVVIEDSDDDAARPRLEVARSAQAAQIVRLGDDLFAWFGTGMDAPHGIGAGDWISVEGMAIAGYEDADRRAVVGVPAGLANLSQVTGPVTVGWRDSADPSDRIDHADVFDAAALLPATDLQEILTINREPPAAIDARTRYRLGLRARAMAVRNGIGPGDYVRLENVTGTPTRTQRNVWRVTQSDPLALRRLADDADVPVSLGSPLRGRKRNLAPWWDGDTTGNDWFPRRIENFMVDSNGDFRSLFYLRGLFTGRNRRMNIVMNAVLPSADRSNYALVLIHYDTAGNPTWTEVLRLADGEIPPSFPRKGRDFKWPWGSGAGQHDYLEARRQNALGGTWSLLTVDAAFDGLNLTNLTWRGHTVDVRNITSELQTTDLVRTAHSRWAPLARDASNAAQTQSVRGVESVAVSGGVATVTVETGAGLPAAGAIVRLDDLDQQTADGGYAPVTDEFAVVGVTAASRQFTIRVAAGRAFRVDPGRSPFDFTFTPSAAGAIRFQALTISPESDDYEYQGGRTCRILAAGDNLTVFDTDGTERFLTDLTLSLGDGRLIGLGLSSTRSPTDTPVALSSDANANYRVYVRVTLVNGAKHVIWGDLSADAWLTTDADATPTDARTYQMPAQNRPTVSNWFTSAAAGAATFDVYVVDKRSQFGFDQASRTIGHHTRWRRVTYGAATPPAPDRGNRVTAAAYAASAQTLTLTAEATTGVSAGDKVQVVGLTNVPDWWLLTVTAVTATQLTCAAHLRAAPALGAVTGDPDYPYWRKAALRTTPVYVSKNARERLFAGFACGAQLRHAGRSPAAGMLEWTVRCAGYGQRLEDAVVRGAFAVSSDDRLGPAISALLTGHASGSGVTAPPEVAGRLQPLVPPGDVPAGRTGAVRLDTLSWTTVQAALDRLLEQVRGAWAVDGFGRLRVTLPSSAPTVHALALDQQVNVRRAAFAIDPSGARAQTAVVGAPQDAGVAVETFTGDGKATRFALTRRMAPERFAFAALSFRASSSGTFASMPLDSSTAQWKVDYAAGAVVSGADPPAPLPAGAQLRIAYACAEPPLAESAPAAGTGRAVVEGDPAVVTQTQARRRAQVVNALHAAAVHRGTCELVPRRADGTRPSIPPEGSYCTTRLQAFGYYDAYALVERVSIRDDAGVIVTTLDVAVSSDPAALHHADRRRAAWARLLGRALPAAQRLRLLDRRVPEAVVLRQGLGLPASLGGQEGVHHTRTSHGVANGARIMGSGIVRVDGARILPGSLRWYATARVHGSTTRASLFLWDRGYADETGTVVGRKVGGEYAVSGADAGSGARLAVQGGVTPRIGLVEYELRCAVTAGAASGSGDSVEVWAAALDVDAEGEG